MIEAPAYEITCVQGSKEWYDLRARNLTASRFEVIMSGSEKALDTLIKSCRAPRPFSDSPYAPALQWGKHYEPWARAEYEMVSGNRVRSTGLYQHHTLRVSASPDGIVDAVFENQVMTLPLFGVEIKCPYVQAVHRNTLEYGVPEKHTAQIQGNMWLTGAPYWDFISFDPRLKSLGSKIFIQRIHRDSGYIAKLEERVRWLHEILISGGEFYQPERNVHAAIMSKDDIDLF